MITIKVYRVNVERGCGISVQGLVYTGQVIITRTGIRNGMVCQSLPIGCAANMHAYCTLLTFRFANCRLHKTQDRTTLIKQSTLYGYILWEATIANRF